MSVLQLETINKIKDLNDENLILVSTYIDKIQQDSDNENHIVRNPYIPLSEKELLYKLKVARDSIKDGNCEEASKVVQFLREKYGL